jgi:hypothetical protein
MVEFRLGHSEIVGLFVGHPEIVVVCGAAEGLQEQSLCVGPLVETKPQEGFRGPSAHSRTESKLG